MTLALAGNSENLIWAPSAGAAWWEVSTGTPTSASNWLKGASRDNFYQLDTVAFTTAGGGGDVNLSGQLHPADIVVDGIANYRFKEPEASSALEPASRRTAPAR